MPDAAPVASVAPTTRAASALRPLGSGAVRVDDGFWAERQRVRLTAIPYFAWANRAPGAMRVWIRERV